jgi:type I restriction enzyme S subunit
LRTALCKEKGIITSAYIAFKVKNINPEFLNYLIRAYDVSKAFYTLGSGLRQSLRYDELKRIPILEPPETEQKMIIQFLDSATRKHNILLREVEASIKLLQEHRTALISAVVTGKIDIRGQRTRLVSRPENKMYVRE